MKKREREIKIHYPIGSNINVCKNYLHSFSYLDNLYDDILDLKASGANVNSIYETLFLDRLHENLKYLKRHGIGEAMCKYEDLKRELNID